MQSALSQSIASLMGLGASNHVKEIRIDQTDSKWEQTTTHPKSKSKFSLKRFGSAGTAPDRVQQLHGALEIAEKRAQDAEDRNRALERELANLELRNIELNEEVNWLKQQISESPDVPQPHRGKTGSDDDTLHRKVLNAKEKYYEDEIQKLRSDGFRNQQKLQLEAAAVKHEMTAKIISLEEQLDRAKANCQNFEDLARKYIPDDATEQIDNIADLDVPRLSDNRTQLVLELSGEISTQQERISEMEKNIVNRDIEISRLKQAVEFTELTISRSQRTGSSSSQRVQLQPKVSKPTKIENDDIDALLDEAAGVISHERMPSRQKVVTDVEIVHEKPGENVFTMEPRKKSILSETPMRNLFAFAEDLEPLKLGRETPNSSTLTLRPNTADSVRGARNSTKSPLIEENINKTTLEHSNNPLSELSRNSSEPQLFKPRSINRRNTANVAKPISGAHINPILSKMETKRVHKRQSLVDRTEIMSVMENDDRQPLPQMHKSGLSTIADESNSADDANVASSDDGLAASLSRSSASVPHPKPPCGKPRVASAHYRNARLLNKLSEDKRQGSLDSQMKQGSDSDEELKNVFKTKKTSRVSSSTPPVKYSASGRVTSSAKSRDSGYLGDSYASVTALKVQTDEMFDGIHEMNEL